MHSAHVLRDIMAILQLNVLHKLLVPVLEIHAVKMQDAVKLTMDLNAAVHLAVLVILEVDAYVVVSKSICVLISLADIMPPAEY